MSGTSRPGKDVFECGFPHEVGMALGRAKNPPTRQELQRIIIDPMVRDAVVAAVRSAPLVADTRMTPDQLLEREMKVWEYARNLVDDFRENMVKRASPPFRAEGVERLALELLPAFPPIEEAVVAEAIAVKQRVTSELTIWDYFQPQGLEIPHGLALLASLGIPLDHAFGKENWRHWQDVEFLPTAVGVMTCEFNRIGTYWDSQLRPFNLDYDGHIAWAKEAGGDTICSAEEVLARNFRGQLTMGYPVGINDSERCRNACSSALTLIVDMNSVCVGYGDRGGRGWTYGAFPRKFVALDSG